MCAPSAASAALTFPAEKKKNRKKKQQIKKKRNGIGRRGEGGGSEGVAHDWKGGLPHAVHPQQPLQS